MFLGFHRKTFISNVFISLVKVTKSDIKEIEMVHFNAGKKTYNASKSHELQLASIL